jgi:transglutaminase-like putative cysteine protease
VLFRIPKIIGAFIAAFLVSTSVKTFSQSAEPPAASAAFTSKDPVVLAALDLVNKGHFTEAESLLTDSKNGTDDALRARKEALEVIHRTRIEYSLDAAGLLEKVRKFVPNASPGDVERWTVEARSRHRNIDGKKFYFRREASNIFLFCEEAKQRRDQAGNTPVESKWKLTDHLAEVIDQARASHKSEVVPIRHKITYTLTLPSNTPGVKTGSLVRVWLPYPQEYRQQSEIKLLSTSPKMKLLAPSAMVGSGGAAQRSVYFEERVADPTRPLEFKEVFEYVCSAYYPTLDETKVQPLGNWTSDLGERPPHIVFTPELRAKVAEIIGHETNALVKARLIFRWVSKHIRWNAEDEYCTIPSFTLKAFATGRGDCGLQNSVFITMCRIAGIPARWQSGWETKPSHWSNHDWAEFYIAPWGWLPGDASYGVQPSDRPEIADFYCGHQDSYRLIVNLDWGRDFIPPKQSMRSEPADFQVGEVEVDGKNLYFNQWSYNMKIERDPE